MSGEHDDDRSGVEKWELELANKIAGSYRTGDEDLASALRVRLVEIKAKRSEGIRNWQGFLVQSLYNAAKNFIRHEDVLRRHLRTVEFGNSAEMERPLRPEEGLAAPEEPIDLRIDLPRVWEALTPEMRELWRLLFEEEGNTSSVAKRLRRPRKTVEYWIRNLRTFVKNHGIE